MSTVSSTNQRDCTIGFVRPFGRHTLAIPTLEKYSPFKRVKYFSCDTRLNDWNWLPLSKVEIVPISIFQVRAGYTLFSRIYGLEKALVDVDVIDVPEVYNSFCVQAIKSFRRKPAVVTVIETIRRHVSSMLPLVKQNTRFVLEHAALFVALTHKSMDYLLSIGADKAKVKVIHQGVDVRMFYPSGATGDGKIRILTVTELSERRGIRELLQAFEMLSKNHKNVELWVVGRGKLEGELAKYSAKLPITMFGKVPYWRLADIYRRCDIFCLLGKDVRFLGIKILEDGQYTISVLEAMASGLPVVVTNSGSYREILGSDNLLVKQGEIRDAYEKLAMLVEDEKLRRLLGQQNRRRVLSDFNAEKQWRAYYEQVIKVA